MRKCKFFIINRERGIPLQLDSVSEDEYVSILTKTFGEWVNRQLHVILGRKIYRPKKKWRRRK